LRGEMQRIAEVRSGDLLPFGGDFGVHFWAVCDVWNGESLLFIQLLEFLCHDMEWMGLTRNEILAFRSDAERPFVWSFAFVLVH
jgi:hypothetical protein